MADVSKAAEPSMEDILASIRRIVTDEQPGDAVPSASTASGTGRDDIDAVLDLVNAAPTAKTLARRPERRPLRPAIVDDVDDLLEPVAVAASPSQTGVPSMPVPPVIALPFVAPVAPAVAPPVKTDSPELDTRAAARLAQAAGMMAYGKSAVVPNALIPTGAAFQGMPRTAASRPTWQYARPEVAAVTVVATMATAANATSSNADAEIVSVAPSPVAASPITDAPLVVEPAIAQPVVSAVLQPAEVVLSVSAEPISPLPTSQPAIVLPAPTTSVTNALTNSLSTDEAAPLPAPLRAGLAELTQALASLPFATTTTETAAKPIIEPVVEAGDVPSVDAATAKPVEANVLEGAPSAAEATSDLNAPDALVVDAVPIVLTVARETDTAPVQIIADADDVSTTAVTSSEPDAEATMFAAGVEAPAAVAPEFVPVPVAAPLMVEAEPIKTALTEVEVEAEPGSRQSEVACADALTAVDAQPDPVATVAAPEAAQAMVASVTEIALPINVVSTSAPVVAEPAPVIEPAPVLPPPAAAAPPSFAALRSLARAAPTEAAAPVAAAPTPASLPPSWALARSAARAVPVAAAKVPAVLGDRSYASSLAAMEALFPRPRTPSAAPPAPLPVADVVKPEQTDVPSITVTAPSAAETVIPVAIETVMAPLAAELEVLDAEVVAAETVNPVEAIEVSGALPFDAPAPDHPSTDAAIDAATVVVTAVVPDLDLIAPAAVAAAVEPATRSAIPSADVPPEITLPLSAADPVVAPVPVPVAAAAAPAITPRSLEDAVVDLLRPMLRNWIDANMPVMVEKALRAETAAKAPTVMPISVLPMSTTTDAPTQKPN